MPGAKTWMSGILLGGLLLPALCRGDGVRHDTPAAKQGGTVVGLCDGKTSIEVPGLKPGQAMDRVKAQSVSDQLMAEWRRKNPNAHWDEAVADARRPPPPPSQGQGTGHPLPSSQPAVNASVPPAPRQHPGQNGVYENYDTRDEKVWALETQRFVDLGSSIFHDDKQLGGTIGVSCDMCHPNAANTHPETYPKYQVQLQRVALLRDMINWCIENPVKGKPMPDDDPRLRALEAYIIAQRKGVKLEYGKH